MKHVAYVMLYTSFNNWNENCCKSASSLLAVGKWYFFFILRATIAEALLMLNCCDMGLLLISGTVYTIQLFVEDVACLFI